MATQYTAGLTTGQVLTAATMNSIGAAWETWTPTWTGTTNPVIGNGTIEGKYMRINKMVVASLKIFMGTTTTFGTGTWELTAPITAASHPSFLNIGHGRYYDASAAASNVLYVLWNGTSTTKIWLQSPYTGLFGQTAPITWAPNDEFHLQVIYEAA